MTGLRYVLSFPHCIVMIAIGIPVVEGSSPLHLLSSLISLVKLPCSSPDEEALLSYKSYVISITCKWFLRSIYIQMIHLVMLQRNTIEQLLPFSEGRVMAHLHCGRRT